MPVRGKKTEPTLAVVPITGSLHWNAIPNSPIGSSMWRPSFHIIAGGTGAFGARIFQKPCENAREFPN
jgi:hypothetical protein